MPLLKESINDMYNRIRMNVSAVCNFNCPHCHVFTYNPQEKKLNLMKEETFLKAIDAFTKGLKKSHQSQARISIYGGEPLLNKKMLLNVLRAVGNEANGIELEWVINTNGTHLEASDIKELKKADVEVHLSLDGKEDIHNLSRKTLGGHDTFDKVEQALKMLTENHVRTQLNSHLMPTNIHHLHDIIDIASEYQVKKIYLDLSYTPEGVGQAEYLLYKKAYYYALKKGIALAGGWREAALCAWNGQKRKDLLSEKYCVEINVDGSYFYPKTETNKKAKDLSRLESFMQQEHQEAQEKIKHKCESKCSSCSIIDSCYGLALEQVQYHLGEGAKSDSYCDFYRNWIHEISHPLTFKKDPPFIISYSQALSPLYFRPLQNLHDAFIYLKDFFPLTCSGLAPLLHVHLAFDEDEFNSLSGNLTLPEKTQAFTHNGILVLFNQTQISFEALVHELTHLLIGRLKLSLPVWFEEGLCELLAKRQENISELLERLSAQDLISCQESLSANAHTPLMNLIPRKIEENPLYTFSTLLTLAIAHQSFNKSLKTLCSFLEGPYDSVDKLPMELTKAIDLLQSYYE